MRVFRIGLVVCLAAAVLGCSGGLPRGSVTGTITYKGQPVKAGTVYLIYAQGGQYQADLQPNGTYEFMDVPTGDVKVLVDNEAWNPEQKQVPYGRQGRRIEQGYNKSLSEANAKMNRGGAEKKDNAPAAVGPSKEKKEELAKVYVKIPDKYAKQETTTLTYTVARGRQTKDFDLSD